MREGRPSRNYDSPYPWDQSRTWIGRDTGITQGDETYWSLSHRNRARLYVAGYETGDNLDLYLGKLDETDPVVRQYHDRDQDRVYAEAQESKPKEQNPWGVRKLLDYLTGFLIS